MGKPVPAVLGDGLVARTVRVDERDVMLVRALLEAEEGLGVVFVEARGSEDVVVATTESQEAELDRFLDDVAETIPSLFRTNVDRSARTLASEVEDR